MGHCAGVQGGRGIEGGRVAVILEQGNPLQMIQLLQSPWEDRFRVSLRAPALQLSIRMLYHFIGFFTNKWKSVSHVQTDVWQRRRRLKDEGGRHLKLLEV